MTLSIRVTVAMDEPWSKSYWNPSTSAIQREVQKACAEIGRQFPEVEFALTSQARKWDSPDVLMMRDFPWSLLWDFPRSFSVREMIQELSERMENIGLAPISSEEQERVAIHFSHRSRQYQWGYLEGYLSRDLLQHFIKSLRDGIPVEPREFILGFTGRVFAPSRGYACVGLAMLKGNYAVFPMQTSRGRSTTILHEMGHLLGAEHPENERIPSVMDPHGRGITDFDPENIERIRQYIQELMSSA